MMESDLVNDICKYAYAAEKLHDRYGQAASQRIITDAFQVGIRAATEHLIRAVTEADALEPEDE